MATGYYHNCTIFSRITGQRIITVNNKLIMNYFWGNSWTRTQKKELAVTLAKGTDVQFFNSFAACIYSSIIDPRCEKTGFLHMRKQGRRSLLWLYSPVCVGPGRKPRRPVFSRRGSISHDVPHLIINQKEKTYKTYC